MHAAAVQQHPAWGSSRTAECFTTHDQRQAYRPCKERDGHKKALQDKCEFIFFLDSDILVNSDALQKLFIGNLPILSSVYYSSAPV
jgi:hypothetical protein